MLICHLYCEPNKRKPACIAKADSGASNHCWREEDKNILTNLHKEDDHPVKYPDFTTINDNQIGYIPISQYLLTSAQKARVLKDLKSASLILLEQLADDGCTTIIKNTDQIVKKTTTSF